MYCGCKKLKGRENEEEIDGRGDNLGLVEGAVKVDIVVREEVLPDVLQGEVVLLVVLPGEVVLLDVLGEVVLLDVMAGVVMIGEVVLPESVVREGILQLLVGEGSIFVGEMELAAWLGFWMLEEALRAKMAWLIAAIALSWPTEAWASQLLRMILTKRRASGRCWVSTSPCTKMFLVVWKRVMEIDLNTFDLKSYLTLSSSPPAVRNGVTLVQVRS